MKRLDDELDETKIVDNTPGTMVFVTIGIPLSKIPIMQKVMMYVDHATETPATVAKALRKLVADNLENHGFERGTNFTPETLYFEIYGSVDNNIPFFCSTNAPHAGKGRM